MRHHLPLAIIGAVLLIAAGSGLLLFRAKHSRTSLKIAAGKPGAEPAHIRGAANARVTLEEFGDFQCPPCSFLATTLLNVEHDYAASVRVVFREFPLAMHAHALSAACAAEAAGLQGHFWGMHDVLFKNAMTWSRESPRPVRQDVPSLSSDQTATGVPAIFADYAAKMGLDVERFKKDMESEVVRARIKSDQERGVSIGVDRTPIVFIEGVQIPFPSFSDEKELRGIIDAALHGKPPAPASPIPTPAPSK